MVNNTIKASVTASSGTEYSFPEKTPEFLASTSNCGICFSGGGTRSLAACMGQMRALNELGVLQNARYISCVSGGSWASAAYTYYRAGPADDTELLGKDPGAPEMREWGAEDWSNSLKTTHLGYPATADFAQTLKKNLEHKSHNEAWIDAVGEIYFRPYGLDSRHYFSYSSEVVNAIIRENTDLQPGLSADQFILPRENRPFLIINATLLWPVEALHKVSRVLQQFTPLYVGNPFLLQLEEKYIFEKPTTMQTGGGFLDTFAFQSGGPNAAAGEWLEMPAPEEPFSIWHASGISSSAYGYDAARVDFKSVVPQVNYWPVSESDASQSIVAEQYISDGGNLENLGIMALLQRQVETIVVFENSNVPISKDEKGNVVIDSVVTSLFGVQNEAYPNNQVFEKDELLPLLDALWQAKTSGDLCVAQTVHNTVENSWYGIKHYRVKILWVYNAPVDNWIAELSTEVQSDVHQGIKGEGPLTDFPNYKTLDEDGFLSIRLSAYQVSTISNMFSWSMQKNAAAFRDFLPPAE
ncbi:hypothetical protein MNBD_GAMMA11-477 [hydrothermal vent metagenome]|uniref:PNPLA domain-containing protein n=1 Tax=hydrothermal vent metagenome TaxID=652676 RepID=A0A3B0XC08_9ZZZZ